MVKNLHSMQETWVQSLHQEDSLEKRLAPHSSILAWRIPWTEEPSGLQSMGHKELDMTEKPNFHFHLQYSSVLALHEILCVSSWEVIYHTHRYAKYYPSMSMDSAFSVIFWMSSNPVTILIFLFQVRFCFVPSYMLLSLGPGLALLTPVPLGQLVLDSAPVLELHLPRAS